MRVQYCVMQLAEGWMIKREGRLYGPYRSQQEALQEAWYVVNHSNSNGLAAELIVQDQDA